MLLYEPLAERHLPAVLEAILDPDVRRFTGFPEPPDPAFVPGWLARYEAGPRDGTKVGFAAVDGGGAVLGLALAPSIDRTAREAELGYLVLPSARGRGVATELLGWLTGWAFRELEALRLTLRIDISNGASLRVAERCGYVREGVLRNAYVKQGIRADTALLSRLADDPDPS